MFDPSEFERVQRQLAAQLEELSEKFVKAFNGLPKALREAFDSSFAEKFLKVVRQIADANGDTVKELEKELNKLKQSQEILEDQAKSIEQLIEKRRKQSREEQKIVKELLKQAQTQDEINYLQKEATEGIKDKNREVDKLQRLLNNVQAAMKGLNAQQNLLNVKLNATKIAQQHGLAVTKAFGMTLPQLINKVISFKNAWFNVAGAINGAAIGVGVLVKQMTNAYRILRQRGFSPSQAITHVPDVFMAQISGLIHHGVIASQSEYAQNYGNLGNYLGQTDINRGLTATATKLSAKYGGYGLGSEEASHLAGQLNRINNFQAVAATNSIRMVAALATANNIPLNTVMRDLASHTEDVAKYAGRGVDQLARGLIVTRQMGVEFSRISTFADSMVDDFEGSLKAQAELQTYLPGLDLSEVIYASQFGTDDQVASALKTALQRTGLKSIDQLPRSVRNRVTGLLGQGSEGLQNLLGKNSADEKGFNTNTAGYHDNMQGLLGGIADFVSQSKIATGALGLLAFAASTAALSMVGRSALGGRAAFTAARAGGSGLFGASGAALKGMGGAALVGGAIGGGMEVWNSRDQGASWGRSIARGLVTGGLAAIGTVGGALLGGPIGAMIGGAVLGRLGTFIDDKFIPVQPQQLRYPEGNNLNQSVQKGNGANNDQQKVPVDTSALEKKMDTLINVTKGQKTVTMDGKTVGRVITDANSRG